MRMSSDSSFKVQTRPLLAVRDVRASTRWDKDLLGLTRHGVHDHDRVVLQLHSCDADGYVVVLASAT